MKFKVQTRDLVAALNLLSTIKPTPKGTQGSCGYLCVVQGAKCFMYSEDERQKTRVPIPISDVEGEGAFVLPAGHNAAFKYMDVDGELEFEPGEDKGAKVVHCRRTSGDNEASYKVASFDASFLHSFDKDLNGAKETATFPVALLKEALDTTRSYLVDAKDQASTKLYYQNLQLFDASKDSYKSGNGYILGSTGQRACFFYSKELQDKSFVIHGLHLPLLLAFLAKSEGDVRVFNSENSTYFVNAGDQVIGWADQTHAYEKFGFYALAMDRYILKVNRKVFETELRTVRSLIPPEKDKVRLEYDHERSSLTVLANEGATDLKSFPVKVSAVPVDPPDLSRTTDVAFNINADWLLDIIAPVKQEEIELRISPVRDHPDRFLVRTLENYWIDGRGKVSLGDNPPEGQQVHACRVMRFIPSKH